MEISTYSFPTTIHSGPGAASKLSAALKDSGASRPLVVTDKILATLPPIETVRGLLSEGALDSGLFCEIAGNPIKSQVLAGVEAYKSGAHDAIVAVGGGASLDVAKAIALMAHHPGDLFDYLDGDPNCRPFDQPVPFLVAIPTTAGTGSEVGRSAVVSDDQTKVKQIIFSPCLLPALVLMDPKLTLGLPPAVTASTGMDALTHLVEAYVAKGHQPMCDGIALEGVRLVASSLIEAFDFAKSGSVGEGAEGDAHLAARWRMLDASMMGAVAFQKGLGVTHSCAHALSTVCDLHHGLANGIMIPYAMELNLAAVPERFSRLAVMAGLEDASPRAFIGWLRDLQTRLEIPQKLSQVGVKQGDVERLVDIAFADPCHQLNPRAVSRDDFHALFVRAL